MFYRNEHYELVVPLAHTDEQYSSEVDDEDTHPEFDSIYRSKTFARGAYQKQCPKSTGETTSYLHEGKHLPILSEKIETLSIERVYNILIGEKDNDNICEKVPHGIETSASFLIDISKLNCLDDLKSNDGEVCHITGKHYVRYLLMKMEKLSFEENSRRMTIKMDVFTYMNMSVRPNAKTIVAAFILCTVIWRRLIYIDMLLYNFKLILITSTLQHLVEIVKNPVNLI